MKRKTFIFIHGPNGVGKSTVCKALYNRLSRSAWLESEWCRMINPFVLTEESIQLTISTITHILHSYLTYSGIDYVIFSYGFHGPRQRIWETVQANLLNIPFTFVPITLICEEEENSARMIRDERDSARIQRALVTRHLYEGLPYPVIDTTHLTIMQTVDRVIEIAQNFAQIEIERRLL